MARLRGDAADLTRRLKAALGIAKRSDIVDASNMAKIAGMTWRNLLQTHIEPDADFPIFKRGAEGVAWEFEVVKVLKHMLKRASERMKANAASARRLRELTSFTIPDDGNDEIGLVELTKLADLTVKSQAAKERQRMFVPAAALEDFLVRYNSAVISAILGVSQTMDPGGALPQAQRRMLDDELRAVAGNVGVNVENFIKEWCAGSQQGRTD